MTISKLSKNGAVRESASALIDKTNEVIDAVNASGGSDLILGIKDITRDGTTFTATRIDGSTFTFTQQDNDTKALSSMTGTLPITHGGTGATTASNAVSALTGRSWDFNTVNTTDTWVPVATTVNGVGTWRHRSIPTNLATTPTTLWSGNTTANITLSQSVANFKRVTIFYHDNDNLYSSVDVYDPLNKSVLLTSNYSGRYIKSRVVNLNGKAVNSWFYGQVDAVNNNQDDQNLIYITKVLGWSY